jgi:hypothetical protein
MGLIVRAKARAYLKSKSNGKNKKRSRFPKGMTERKARADSEDVVVEGKLVGGEEAWL